MASTHSGIPDTNRTSGTMRPFLQNRAGRAAVAIAPPATTPQPTDAASPPPGTIRTRSPAPVSAPDHPTTVHPVGRQPKLLDRLAEALRARHYSPRAEQTYRHWVKRFIFFDNVDRNQIIVRDGKGARDRRTMLPVSLKPALEEHLRQVKAVHEQDLAEGFGRVQIPDALDRKYPNAGREWGWQWAFPQEHRWKNTRTQR